MENYSTPKKMKKLGDLFGKYQTKFKAPQASVEKACIEAIFKATNYRLKEEMVVFTVSTKTISLNVPSILKSEIKFKHRDILKDLEMSLGKDVSPKVIL
jgi:hypothetical protein